MRRLPYVIAAALVIPAGLGVRELSLPWRAEGPLGDALWAVELYCVLRAMRPQALPRDTAVLCFVLAVLVEASQAIRVPWLDAIRATTIGHLFLGRGFVWLDNLWYAMGTAAAWLVDARLTGRWKKEPV